MSFARTALRLPKASTSATATSPPGSVMRFSSSPRPRAPTPTAEPTITWPSYLKMRRSQRVYALVASIPTTLAGLSLGISQFASVEAAPDQLIMGVEPIYAYGAATIACGLGGWLAGPVVGDQLWRLAHRRVLKAMEIKDKDFYSHIKKWRADPSRQSVSNPVPDYYAERVSSLKNYRTWLRDQRAYKRKATFGDGEDKVF